MDKNKFKKILFKVAFCTMACDGDIDDREITEIQLMDKKANYFADINLSNELDQLINNFNANGVGIIEELFDEVAQTDFNSIQELLILEVAIRVIYADKIVDENEVKFFKFLRSKLKISNNIINDRFGDISDVYDLKQNNEIEIRKTNHEFAETIKLPKMSEIIQIDLKNGNKV
mgnify:CR=1 FL=1|jgi:hypothetical protein